MSFKKTIKENIKDALTQLPSDKAGAIFIYSLSERDAKQAISQFFVDNNLSGLCSVFSWSTTLNYYRNSKSRFNIFDQG